MTWVVFKNTGFGDVEIITLELNHLMCGVPPAWGRVPSGAKTVSRYSKTFVIKLKTYVVV